MAKLSHLLLFDTDPSGLETLTYVFEKEGIVVNSAGDAAKARELIQSSTSTLLVVALREPELVGLDLIRATHNNLRTRTMACLALGPPKSRGAAMQAGAFGYLSSPLFVRDVVDACKLIAAATIPGSRASAETEISISLGEIGGVYYLIRALAASARSAAVEIQRGARRGELRFLDGNLSSVQLGGLSGMAALHQLLLWEEADLRLKFRNVVRRGGHMSLKNEEVIEQCDRFLRDFAHEVRDMGGARTVYRPSDRAVQPTAALPSEVVPLLRLFDGKRDLAQILDESPFRTFDTIRVARQFMNAGAVVTDPPLGAWSSDAPLAGGPAALDAWFGRPGPAAARASGPGASDESAGVPTAAVERSSTPFVKIASLTTAAAVARAAASPAIPLTHPKERKPRTITQREHAIDNATPPPIPPAAQVSTAHSFQQPALQQPAFQHPPFQPAIPTAIQPANPPATTAVAAAPVVAASAPGSERLTKPAATVARGEIHVTPLTPKKADRAPKPSAPTVLVEIGEVPTPRPIASVTPIPLAARATPPAPARTELPGPRTPLPILTTPAVAKARTVTPAPLVAKAPAAVRPASDAVEPVTPPPVVKAPAKTPGPAAPAPVATNANVSGTRKSGVPGSHRTRTPSSGFSAVEADFFSREADLYKGDSAETFDDLDSGTGTDNPPQLLSGRRRPVRKS